MPSTKLIPGFAKSMAQKFMVSCEHIGYMMERDGIEVCKADLLDGTISPPALDVRRNCILIEQVGDNLKRLMKKYPDVDIAEATLVFRCSSQGDKVTVSIIDVTGKGWSGTVE